MKRISAVIAVPMLMAISSMSVGEPIYIQPGQCILVGSQQVCATKDGTAGQEGTTTIHACRYGKHDGSDIPDLASYALLQIMVRGNGVKTETVVKNYGPSGKDDCEKDAERYRAGVVSKKRLSGWYQLGDSPWTRIVTT